MSDNNKETDKENEQHQDYTLPPPKTETVLIKIAIGLAQKDPSRFDELRLKLINKGIVGLDSDHPYYAFFYSKYKEFRDDPSALALASAAVSSSKNEPTAKKLEAETQAKSTRERLEEAAKHRQQKILSEAESEAKRLRTDPYPKEYQLLIEPGVCINRVSFDTMSLTAQYAAKCACLANSRRQHQRRVAIQGNTLDSPAADNNGVNDHREGITAFLEEVRESYQNTSVFRFLNESNPMHKTFMGLVSSYEKILNFDGEKTQRRLEPFENGGAQFDRILEEMREYYKAGAARRRATLLTECELKKRLNWTNFVVVGSYSLQDLGFSTTSSSTVGMKKVKI